MKIILSLILGACFLITGCDTADRKTKEPTATPAEATAVNSTSANGQNPQGSATTAPPQTAPDKATAATADMCNCFNSFLSDMSPRVRKILVDASKSANPMVVLSTELQKVNSAEEQENLAREFQKFDSDPTLIRCSEEIKKKYGIDETDKASQDAILKAAAENKNCEVMYALMKIGMQYERTQENN